MDAQASKSREPGPQPGNVVRIIGNKRFSSQKNKLAVVVTQPKSKQRRSPEKGGSPKALPIGGWHYIICLNSSQDEAELKPASVQGNAIKLEQPTAEERAAADEVLQRYDQLQKQFSGSLSESSEQTRFKVERSGSKNMAQLEARKEAQLKVMQYCDFCESALARQGIPSDTIQTVTAGITLFGMRSEEEMDFMAMLREWKAMPRNPKKTLPQSNPAPVSGTNLSEKASVFTPPTPQALRPMTHPAASHMGAMPHRISPRVDSVVV